MDKGDLILLGTVSVIGALTGLGLSFTALSPLVIGGIVAAVPIILFAAYGICDSVKKGEFSKKDLFEIAGLCVASAAIGVGLAAAATAIFPGAMLGLGSAALAGATIGVIAPIAGCFVFDKVNNYVISPIIECFSSKGNVHKPVQANQVRFLFCYSSVQHIAAEHLFAKAVSGLLLQC